MALNLKVREMGGKEVIDIRVNPSEDIAKTVEKIISYWGLDEDRILRYDGERLVSEKSWMDYDIEDGSTVSLEKRSNNRLPKHLWRRRIENEIDSIRGAGIERCGSGEEIELEITLKDTPGPVKVDREVGLIFTHEFDLVLPRDYPFSPPRIRWRTPIFHPNIRRSTDDHPIRMKYLDEWDIGKNISVLIEKIRDLLSSPDPERELDLKRCNDALREYRSGSFPSSTHR